MTINIADNTPRVSYSVAAGVTQTSFTVTFEFFAEADLNVYIDSTLKTLTTDYTVTGGNGSTGSITMSVTGAAGGSTVVITREIAFERTTDFPSQGAFQVTTLNTELDRLTAVAADLNDEISRSLRLTDYDSSANTTLPAKADRAGRFLAFDTNGNPTATTNVGDFKGNWAASTTYRIGDLVKDTTDDSIFRVNADHTSSGSLPLTTNTNAALYILFVDLSDINASEAAAAASASAAASSASAASTSETNAAASASTASTQATNSATSATSSANSATAAQTAQAAAEAALDTFDDRFLGAKASDPTLDNDGNALLDGAIYFNTTDDIMKVYDLTNTVWRNLALTGTDQTNVNIVAGQISPTNNIATVAGVASNIPTVAGINATHLSNVSSVATEVGILGTADAVADMNVLGTSATVADMDTLADRATDIATLADIEDGTTATNAISIVAANLSGITAFSEVYASGPNDPTTNLNEGDLFFNTTSDTLKVYNGSAWEQGVTAGSGFLALSGGQLTGNLTFSSTQTVDGRDVSVDGTKLDGIEAGATADQTPSELLTAIKTVDGSGSGLDADLLDGVDSGSFLRSDVADTKTSGDLSFADNVKAIFGAGSDLQIYHSGADSYIVDAGTGDLYIRASNELRVQDGNQSNFLYAVEGGDLRLYHNGSQKLATTSTGVDVTGVITTDGMTTSADINFGDSDKAVFGAGNDLQIYHDGSNSYIYENGTGDLKIATNGGNIRLQKTLTEIMGDFKIDGSVDLYHNNVKKFETTSSGVSVTGTVAATAVTGDGSGLTNLPTSGYNAPWVNFNGTGTVAIRDSLLTSSISDLGTGDYRHNFSSSCANSSYAVANGGSRDDPENSRTFMIHIDNLATGSYDISCHNDGSTSVDFTNLFSITQGDF